MKVWMLCGVFDAANEEFTRLQAKGQIEYSANMFQEKLISGFQEAGNTLKVLSAPFLGAWPQGSRTLRFRGYPNPSVYCYVPFWNLWGLRNFSRGSALKKALRTMLKNGEQPDLLVVYSAHEPFLAAAAYAKKRCPGIKVCFVVPDLPQYMNLNENRSRLYDVLKRQDIRSMERHMSCVDTFVLLTEQMKELLPVGDRPTLIQEGLIQTVPNAAPPAHDEKLIVYAGKTNRKFGVCTLVDAFCQMDGDCRLVICGCGDADSYIAEKAALDGRILATGQIPLEEAMDWIRRAAVLVNPRQNGEVYTKYSFPSKTIDYLLTGRPVVGWRLEGMPRCYEDFLVTPRGENAAALAEALTRALTMDTSSRYQAFLAYARTHLLCTNAARALIDLS